MMSVQNIVPYDLEDRFNDLFVNALERTNLTNLLADETALSTEKIKEIGNAVEPHVKVKRCCNGLVYITSKALKNGLETCGLSAERMYATGDYCGTAVGAFRSAQVVTYIKPKENRTPPARVLVGKLRDYLARHYEEEVNQKMETTEFGGVEVEVDGCNILVKSKSLTLTLSFCDLQLSSGRGDIAMKMQEILKMMMVADNAELEDLRPGLEEGYARFITSLPSSWLSFVRFCKYWSLLTFGPILPMEFIETIAIKLLIRQDCKINREDLNLENTFLNFLLCLSEKDMFEEVNDVVVPPSVFQRPAVQNLTSVLSTYGPQPAMTVNWNDFPKHASDRVMTGLIDRTINYCDTINEKTWNSVATVVESILQKEDENGLSSAAVFSCVPTRRPNRAKAFLKSLVLYFFFFSAVGLIASGTFLAFFLDSSGQIDTTKVLESIRIMEEGFIDMTTYLLKNDLQPIVDSSAYSCLEDSVGHALDMFARVPELWQQWVPLVVRLNLSECRDSSLQLMTEAHRWIMVQIYSKAL